MQLQEDSVCLDGFECQQLYVFRVYSFVLQKSLVFAYLKQITHNNSVGLGAALFSVHMSVTLVVFIRRMNCVFLLFFPNSGGNSANLYSYLLRKVICFKEKKTPSEE